MKRSTLLFIWHIIFITGAGSPNLTVSAGHLVGMWMPQCVPTTIMAICQISNRSCQLTSCADMSRLWVMVCFGGVCFLKAAEGRLSHFLSASIEEQRLCNVLELAWHKYVNLFQSRVSFLICTCIWKVIKTFNTEYSFYLVLYLLEGTTIYRGDKSYFFIRRHVVTHDF